MKTLTKFQWYLLTTYEICSTNTICILNVGVLKFILIHNWQKNNQKIFFILFWKFKLFHLYL